MEIVEFIEPLFRKREPVRDLLLFDIGDDALDDVARVFEVDSQRDDVGPAAAVGVVELLARSRLLMLAHDRRGFMHALAQARIVQRARRVEHGIRGGTEQRVEPLHVADHIEMQRARFDAAQRLPRKPVQMLV